MPDFSPVVQFYKHQEDVWMATKARPNYAIFWEMGLGKTKVTIDTFSWLFINYEIDGVIIMAPKGAYRLWECDELPRHLPSSIPTRTFLWDADANKSERRILEASLFPMDNVLDILVMNVEALSSDRAFDFARRFVMKHHTFAVVDESSYIKNPSAIRTKNCIKLGREAEYRRILTGTPMAKSPLDLYSQFDFLQEGLLGYLNYTSYKCQYAITQLQKSAGGRSYEIILDYKNTDELTEVIKPISSRLTKEECLDLPDKIWEKHYVYHTKEQAQAYEQIKEESLIMLSETKTVSATSVLTVIMKLHQINCGFMMTDSESVPGATKRKPGELIPIRHTRIDELLEIIALIPEYEKVIIWAHFQYSIREIKSALEKVYGPRSAIDYYGETLNRQEQLEWFKNPNGARFMVSNSVGARGLTIVEASYNIMYSYDYDLDTWLQKQDRTHRPGQKNNCTYVVMEIPKTVDSAMLSSLQEKKNLADEVLDNWRTMI
jgi:SNF2 family DNA or RNA helicase